MTRLAKGSAEADNAKFKNISDKKFDIFICHFSF